MKLTLRQSKIVAPSVGLEVAGWAGQLHGAAAQRPATAMFCKTQNRGEVATMRGSSNQPPYIDMSKSH